VSAAARPTAYDSGVTTVDIATILLFLATVGLVAATVGLVIVGLRQASATAEQVRLTTETLSMQRAMLEEMRFERAERDPFDVRLLPPVTSIPGVMQHDLVNGRSDKPVQISVVIMDNLSVDEPPRQALRAHTLGAGERVGLHEPYPLDAYGQVLMFVVRGRPIGGDVEQERRFLYRIAPDGHLVDLQTVEWEPLVG
jgi:hypothetical protein